MQKSMTKVKFDGNCKNQIQWQWQKSNSMAIAKINGNDKNPIQKLNQELYLLYFTL
jgi:hypothetical protein